MTEIMSPAKVAAALALAEAATEGPWETDNLTSEVLEGTEKYYEKDCPHGCEVEECSGHIEGRAYMVHGFAHIPEDDDEGWYFNEADATFIAAARQDLPRMAASHEELRALLRPFAEWARQQGTPDDMLPHQASSIVVVDVPPEVRITLADLRAAASAVE